MLTQLVWVLWWHFSVYYLFGFQNQLMVNWWFGILAMPISNHPIPKGIPGIQTTNPNHQFTISWQNSCLPFTASNLLFWRSKTSWSPLGASAWYSWDVFFSPHPLHRKKDEQNQSLPCECNEDNFYSHHYHHFSFALFFSSKKWTGLYLVMSKWAMDDHLAYEQMSNKVGVVCTSQWSLPFFFFGFYPKHFICLAHGW